MEIIKYFTSESVMAGHPDKICDRISDAILDAILKQDRKAHVGCETMVTSDLVLVTGEVKTSAAINYEQIIRNTILELGYNTDKYGFNGHNCKIMLAMKQQSPDIAMGVEQGKIIGAGDQGMMFGFACNETKEYMPLAANLAHALVRQLDIYRRENPELLGPDGKAQVTVKYNNKQAVAVDTIVVSVQHADNIYQEKLERIIREHIIKRVIPKELLDEETKIYINPTGRFVEGGPKADAGLTGRKIIVDTYGGYAAHGGGAFSGKDPTKVDRTGAYMARYIAKNLVAAGLAQKCQVELAYAIGKDKPVSIGVDCFGTSDLKEEELVNIIKAEFDLTPLGIIREMDLLRPIYKETSAYGHFGRKDNEFPWERLDRTENLKAYINNSPL